MKLVHDTDFPPPRETNPYADYGTLGHYISMDTMGLRPPVPKDIDLLTSSAASLYHGSPEKLYRALDLSVAAAVANVPTLPSGDRWVCELRKHDERILPDRVSRDGNKGFGGVIDLMASSRSRLLDFKFVSKIPDRVKLSYLWQMASYHLVTGVPKCILLFTTRPRTLTSDPSIQEPVHVASCTLDFTEKRWAQFAFQASNAISAMGHASFRRNAYYGEGDQCQYCTHKATRCPLQAKPHIVEHRIPAPAAKPDPFMSSMVEALRDTNPPIPPVIPTETRPATVALETVTKVTPHSDWF